MNYTFDELVEAAQDESLILGEEDSTLLFYIGEDFSIYKQSTYEKYQRIILDQYGFDAFPYAGTDPYILQAENNYRYKFMQIIMTDDSGKETDRVGLFFKFYAMYGHHGSYLWFKPISLNKNLDNEKLVFDLINKYQLIKGILVPKVIPTLDYSKLKLRNDDYYCYVEERYKEINRSKWRSSKGINKLNNDFYISMNVNYYDPQELHKLSYYWWKLHKKQNCTLDKHLNNMLYFPDNMKYVLTWKLNGQLLGFTIITTHFSDIPVARIQHNRNLLKTEIDPDLKILTQHLADYMHYKTIEFCHNKGYKVVYIGDAANGPYLKKYKSRNFNHVVQNYDLPISDYLELYK